MLTGQNNSRSCKLWVASLFIVLLLYPGLPRIGHLHQHHPIIQSGNPVGFQEHFDHCEICNFHFSSFVSNLDVILPVLILTTAELIPTPLIQVTTNFSGYIFPLRGPPGLCNENDCLPV